MQLEQIGLTVCYSSLKKPFRPIVAQNSAKRFDGSQVIVLSGNTKRVQRRKVQESNVHSGCQGGRHSNMSETEGCNVEDAHGSYMGLMGGYCDDQRWQCHTQRD